jgi:hypothetical protein
MGRYATLAQQFLHFLACERDTVRRRIQSIVSNLCELSGSGVSKIWEV